jgi:5-methylcytosine-specific restriction endonuclease McrA
MGGLPRCCEVCGATFYSLKPVQFTCGAECRKERARKLSNAHYAANDNVDRTPRPCAECAKIFSPAFGSKRSVYCCSECAQRSQRRVAHRAARARLRLVKVDNVDPTKVFVQHGWTCARCGQATPRDLRGSYEPNAPELDHVVPLSKGGEHSYANTQCLCRQCNAEKSDALPLAA